MTNYINKSLDLRNLEHSINLIEAKIKEHLREIKEANDVDISEDKDLIVIDVHDDNTRIVIYKDNWSIKGLDYEGLELYKLIIAYTEYKKEIKFLIGGGVKSV